jgi:hypothetical protein
LLTDDPATGACPPGVDPAAFALALAEDVIDLLEQLAGVEVAIACAPGRRAEAERVRWPGMAILDLPEAGGPRAALHLLAGAGYDVGAVVAPDVPDLPGLVLAKPFSALSSSLIAVTPATGGGIAVLAARLPVPPWLPDVDLGVEPEALQLTAPRRRDVRISPPWHRMRRPEDIALLDPQLEGWEATRALLS